MTNQSGTDNPENLSGLSPRAQLCFEWIDCWLQRGNYSLARAIALHNAARHPQDAALTRLANLFKHLPDAENASPTHIGCAEMLLSIVVNLVREAYDAAAALIVKLQDSAKITPLQIVSA